MTAVNTRISAFKQKVVDNGNFRDYVHYSEYLERSLNGVCLIFPDKILEIMNYIKTPDVFYFDKQKIIFEAMVRLIRRGEKVDLFTVTYEIINRGTFDNEVIGEVKWDYECALNMRDVTGDFHAMDWCMYLIQFYVKRETIYHAFNVLNVDNPLQAAKELNDRINFALSFEIRKDWFTVDEIINELYERREKIKAGAQFGVPTGFRELDLITGGGFQAGLIVICARPAMGKTAFALSLALNMAKQGIPIGVISLEMPNVQLAGRIMAQISNFDFKTIFNGSYQADVESGLDLARNNINSIPLYISDTSNMDIHNLKYKIKKMIEVKKVRAVFIDYLQLVDVDTEKNEPRYVAVGRLSRELKLLSKEEDIPIIVLAQLNRESEGADKQSKIGKVSQLRETGSIEQDMDMGIVVDRPYKRGHTHDENGNTLEFEGFIDVQKHRNGEERLIHIKYDPKRMLFYSPEREHENNLPMPIQDNFRIPSSDRTQLPNIDLPF